VIDVSINDDYCSSISGTCPSPVDDKLRKKDDKVRRQCALFFLCSDVPSKKN
jgi:hypothetical protein